MFLKLLFGHLFTVLIGIACIGFVISRLRKKFKFQTNRKSTHDNRKKNPNQCQCKGILCQVTMTSSWALRCNECGGFTHPCAYFADRKTRLAYAFLWIMLNFKNLTPALLPPLYLQGLYYINTHYKHTVCESLPWQDVNWTCVCIILQSKSLYLM